MTDTDRQKQPAPYRSTARRTTPLGSRGFHLGLGLGVLALAGGLAACSGGPDTTNAAATASASPSSAGPSAVPSTLAPSTPTAKPADLRKLTCEYRKDDTGSPAKFVGYPPKRLSAAVIKASTMTIKTNLGDIVIELATGDAPCTVNSFAFLARKNFFDNTVCHRLTTVETNGLGLLQCGDPQAKGDGENPTDGTGGPGYLFNDENLGPQYTRGVVFMAQPGDASNSNGSQFAISYTDENAQLPQAYTPFGMVKKGMDIVDKIVKGGVNTAKDGVDITSDDGGSNAPKIKVRIRDVTVS
ncbi:peptidylprolyl isomerase [Microbispora corallina]|uniref:Peptidyl-prolyl cis-trans isomerase n=1 Tax=Microbispora corallina TaxID=83302 RepID=A0ABQ4G9S9_9ACTN|nr:peptidylprolyl isomerase [Microbispora corallina]GIH43838.1 peptidyl-prolyl cis-trans isomerase [Microbispora corallina]